MQLEDDWVCRPVVRLDLSEAGATGESLKAYLDDAFHAYEQHYHVEVRRQASLAVRLKNIIKTACLTSGQQVAVLINEYDAPLQHSWKTPEHKTCTDIYRETFAVLKSTDEFEHFVLITGITQFT